MNYSLTRTRHRWERRIPSTTFELLMISGIGVLLVAARLLFDRGADGIMFWGPAALIVLAFIGGVFAACFSGYHNSTCYWRVTLNENEFMLTRRADWPHQLLSLPLNERVKWACQGNHFRVIKNAPAFAETLQIANPFDAAYVSEELWTRLVK